MQSTETNLSVLNNNVLIFSWLGLACCFNKFVSSGADATDCCLGPEGNNVQISLIFSSSFSFYGPTNVITDDGVMRSIVRWPIEPTQYWHYLSLSRANVWTPFLHVPRSNVQNQSILYRRWFISDILLSAYKRYILYPIHRITNEKWNGETWDYVCVVRCDLICFHLCKSINMNWTRIRPFNFQIYFNLLSASPKIRDSTLFARLDCRL